MTKNATDKVECGDCYGAKQNETHCCQTCQDVLDAYREKRWNPDPEKFEQCRRENYVDKEGEAKKLALNEGCQIYGAIEVNRVSAIFCCFHQRFYLNFFVDGRIIPCGTWEKFLVKSYSHS